MKVLALTVFFIIIIYWQTKDLVKNQAWKELAVYSLLMSIGMIYSYGIIFDLSLPNPTLILTNFFKPVYEYIFDVLLA